MLSKIIHMHSLTVMLSVCKFRDAQIIYKAHCTIIALENLIRYKVRVLRQGNAAGILKSSKGPDSTAICEKNGT